MRDDRLAWCFKQKNGIRMIEPNENLSKAYLKKAISALNTMTAALKIKETDWIVTTAYYARYFALYALLVKIGIKSEIHDCTIALGRYFSQNGILSEELIKDIEIAKQTRVDTQYYVAQQFSTREIRSNVESARKFVLNLERITIALTLEQTENIRQQVIKLQS